MHWYFQFLVFYLSFDTTYIQVYFSAGNPDLHALRFTTLEPLSPPAVVVVVRCVLVFFSSDLSVWLLSLK